MALRDEEIDRYSRQILVPEVGGRGQERLLHSSVTYAGTCETTTTAIEYLSAAGVRVSCEEGPEAPHRGATDFLLLAIGDSKINTIITATTAWRTRARRLVVAEETKAGVWYSRGTLTGDCIRCIVDGGREAAGTLGSSPALSAAQVAGAAIALDIISELLRLSPADDRSVVTLASGGTMRRREDLDLSTCIHRTESARIASGA